MKKKIIMRTAFVSSLCSLCLGLSMPVHAAATLDEMAAEIPMYDPTSGEYFLAENQEDADSLMEDYGYVQITKESFDTHVPEIVRTAEDVKKDAEKKDQTSDGESDTASSKESGQESSTGSTAVGAEENSSAEDSSAAETEVKESTEDFSETKNDSAEQADVEEDEAKSEHGPYTGYTEDAHKALLSYLETEDADDDYIEIYGVSDSITITAEELTELCNEHTPFAIRIVGPKENVLYQYDFLPDRTETVKNDLELKMTAVPDGEIQTYLSFHKNQTLEFPITFSYPVKYANTNYDLRDEDGNTILSGCSNQDKMLVLKLGETGNYYLVNTDLEKSQQGGSDEKSDSEQSHFALSEKQGLVIAAGAGCFIVLITGILIFRNRRGK